MNSSRRKETFRSSTKKRYDSRRDWLNAVKAVPCADCGNSYPPECMDFDHKDPLTKAFHIGNALSKRLSTIIAEIEKCEVVCANCHRIRTYRRKK